MPGTQSNNAALTPDEFMSQHSSVLTPDKFMADKTDDKPKHKVDLTATKHRAKTYFETHPIIREGVLGALSGVGIPESQHPVEDMVKGLWHTIVTPPSTSDEKAAAAIGLPAPVYRMAKGFIQQEYGFGQEAFNAIDWNKVKDQFDWTKQAENVENPGVLKRGKAPRFAHGMAGLVTSILSAILGGEKAPEAGEAVTEAASKAAKLPGKIGEDITVTAQRMAKTGPRSPGMAEDIAKSAVKDQTAQIEANAKARQDWTQKAYEDRGLDRAKAKVLGHKESLDHAQDAYTHLVDENVKSTHQAVRSDLDQRWNKLRDTVGAESPVNVKPVYQAIETARAKLSGVPADLKIFNDIIKEISEPGQHIEGEHGELIPVIKDSIPFHDARHHFSALGEKAYSAEGNVKGRLLDVYNAYDKAINATIDEVDKKSAAAGKPVHAARMYSDLKKDWSQYMNDWHNTGAEGSPLAKLYRTADLPRVAKRVVSDSADRLRSTFAHYKAYGADPELMTKLGDIISRSKIADKMAARIKAPPLETIVYPEGGKTEGIRLPSRPFVPPVEPLTIDKMVEKLKEAKRLGATKATELAKTPRRYDFVLAGISALGLAKALGVPLGWHDIAYALPYTVARFGEGALVASRLGQEWLSKVTPRDIEVMNKILDQVPSERPKVQDAVVKGLEAKVKSGGTLPPLATFNGLLTRAQMIGLLRLVAPPPPSIPRSQTQPQPQGSNP